MKIQDLKNRKTVMIKPKGLINHIKMEVTETPTGFTISNYSNKKKEALEFLFIVDSQQDLFNLDIIDKSN